MDRKPTSTDRVLSFNSHHPASAKRAVVIALFDGVNTHYREEDENGKHAEIGHLYAMLKVKGYPRQFVDNTLQHCRITRKKKNTMNRSKTNNRR